MKTVLAEWHGQASLEDARRIREALAVVLEKYHVRQAQDFLLAAAELIVNLSRYPVPKPEHICVRFARDTYFWWLEVLDDGATFTDFNQKVDAAAPLEAAESGMGLKLLARRFDDVTYLPACYRDDRRNLMSLRQPIHDVPPLKKVLVVDDDPVWRAVLQGYLEQQYDVSLASSAEMGLDLIQREKPELVVCDLSMPEYDGSALFEWMSHIPHAATTAFIFLSGCEDKALIEQALSRPIDDFIRKPVDKSLLLQTMARVIARRRHMMSQLQRQVEEKITLGLHPALPGNIGDFACALRTALPEAGGGDLVLLRNQVIVFADLMGHGIQAKGFAYALAGYLRGLLAASCSAQVNIAAMLEQVAREFDDDPVLQQTLATLIAVELKDDGRISMVNAGQPHPCLIRANEVCDIPVEGPLPGLMVDGYRPVDMQLERGDRVLFYSDGFVDSAEEIDAELMDCLQQSAALPLDEAADSLIQFRRDRGRVDDDITLILLERC